MPADRESRRPAAARRDAAAAITSVEPATTDHDVSPVARLARLQATAGNAAVARGLRGDRPGRLGGDDRSASSRQLRRDADPAPPEPVDTYTLTLSDGVHAAVSKADAIALLTTALQSLDSAIAFDAGEYGLVNEGRLSFFGAIGGALTDLAGQDFPKYEETWGKAYDTLVHARRELRAGNVRSAGDHLRDANAAYEKGRTTWYAYKAQLEGAAAKAQVGIVVVAVVAVAVIATGGAVAAAIAPAAGGGGAAGGVGVGAAGIGGAGAAGSGGVAVGGGVGGAAAVGATVPVDAAAAGVATTGIAGGGGAVVGGGAGAAGGAGGAALAGTVPAAAAGGGGSVAAGAAGGVTAVGVGGATADAIVGTAIADTSAALTTGGPAAAAATADGIGITILEAAYGRLVPILAANAPFTTAEARALKQVADIIFEAIRRHNGFPRPM